MPATETSSLPAAATQPLALDALPAARSADPAAVHAYIVGGGIAGLAAAAYMIRTASVPPQNITVLESLKIAGGSMDGNHSPDGKGYLMRGGRMFDREAYACLYDLASEVPSLRTPGKTVKDDIWEFSSQVPTDAHARLVEADAVKIDSSRLGIPVRDVARLSELLVAPESVLDGVRINDFFTADFFESNFWFMMRSTFAFQPWHSLIEFKRYCLRFMHEVPKLYNLGGVWRSPYNQYDSIIKPLVKQLQDQGVQFVYGARVTNIEFEVTQKERNAYRVHWEKDSAPQPAIELRRTDVLFVTLGSMTAASQIGADDRATGPVISAADGQSDPAWALWREIARKQPDFGHPDVFCGRPADSMFLSYTTTLRKPSPDAAHHPLMARIIEWSANEPGTGALVTFKASRWGLSVVVAHQPHFDDQPDDVEVFWGYGLFPDEVGDFVKKPMRDCTGAEMLRETLGHFDFLDAQEGELMKDSITVPSLLPYTMSEFMVRRAGDRPQVVPQGASNFAFMGQYVEIPEGVVFTVDYSIQGAQIAVFKHFKVAREVTPLYHGWRDPVVVLEAARAILGLNGTPAAAPTAPASSQ
ncbi:hypothetical protein HK405_005118 [Cladochytrium tenue]|nr:hypothetical protein HK405_005118 [Cladochytrium tenue]